MLASAVCFTSGLYISALGVHLRRLWLLYLGYGVIGGIGLGLGYIWPVSTLVKWFIDQPGMATGLAIMGFGSSTMMSRPLAVDLMAFFGNARQRRHRPDDAGDQMVYGCFMLFGAVPSACRRMCCRTRSRKTSSPRPSG